MFNPENFQSDRYVIGGGHLYDVIRDEVVPANEPVILLRASRLECVQVALEMAQATSFAVLDLELNDAPDRRSEVAIRDLLFSQSLAMAKHFDSQKPVPLGISFSGRILRIQ